jgi:hypothetical protein
VAPKATSRVAANIEPEVASFTPLQRKVLQANLLEPKKLGSYHFPLK